MEGSNRNFSQQKKSTRKLKTVANINGDEKDIVKYTVKEGDTLLGIAMKHQMEAAAIRKLNSLFGSAIVFPGQVLLVNAIREQDKTPVGEADGLSLLSAENDSYANSNQKPDLETKGSDISLADSHDNKTKTALQPGNAESLDEICEWQAVEEEFVPMLEEVDVCLLGKNNRDMSALPGYLSINLHYLSFRPVYRVHGRNDSKKKRPMPPSNIDLSFRIDVADLRACDKVLTRQYAGTIENQVKVDYMYLQLSWENLILQMPVSSIFLKVKKSTAERIISHVNERIESYKSGDRRRSVYTSGSCLERFARAELKYYYLIFAKEEENSHGRARSCSADSGTAAVGNFSPLGKVKEWFSNFPTPSKDRNERHLRKSSSERAIDVSVIKKKASHPSLDTVGENSDSFSNEEPIFFEKPSRILSCPTHGEKMRKSLKSALPYALQSCSWNLVYDFFTDGISLEKLYAKTEHRAPTLMIIKTVEDDIFGILASDAWCMSKGRSFYGTGETFVFSFDKRNENELCLFRWTKKNNLFMHSTSTHLAVGAGGAGFAVCVDSDLEHGTSNACETFGNPKSLLSSDGNEFVLESLEVFSFEARLAKSPSDKVSPAKGRRRASLFGLEQRSILLKESIT